MLTMSKQASVTMLNKINY